MDVATLGEATRQAKAFTQQYASPAGFVAPQAVIFDTDFSTDCDDVVSLRLLLAQRRRGVVDLLAIVCSSTPQNNKAARALESQLIEEDAAELVVGQWVGDATGVSGEGAMLDVLLGEYPTRTTTGNFENAVRTLRRALAARTKADVNYVCVGFLVNLAALLQSPADDLSPLTGMQLFKKAVARLIIMGGHPTVGEGAESNLNGNPAATAYVLANSPVPQEWHRTDVGAGVNTGTVLNQLPATDIARRAFEAMGRIPVGRASFDPIATLSGCYTDASAIGLTKVPATVAFDTASGIATYTDAAGAKNYYVTRANTTVAKLVAQIDPLLVPGHEPVSPKGAARRPLATAKAIPWTPARLSKQPLVWLRASSLTGAAASAVATWAQEYGAIASVAATQTDATKQPTLQSGYRDRACVRFAGAAPADYLDVLDANIQVTRPVLFAVLTQTGSTGYQSVAGFPQSASASVDPYWRFSFTIRADGFIRFTGLQATATPSQAVGDWTSRPRIVEVAHSARPRLYLDGTLKQSGTSGGDVTYPSSLPLRIGANGGGAEGLNGDLYELVLVDGASTTVAELRAIREYLLRVHPA